MVEYRKQEGAGKERRSLYKFSVHISGTCLHFSAQKSMVSSGSGGDVTTDWMMLDDRCIPSFLLDGLPSLSRIGAVIGELLVVTATVFK